VRIGLNWREVRDIKLVVDWQASCCQIRVNIPPRAQAKGIAQLCTRQELQINPYLSAAGQPTAAFTIMKNESQVIDNWIFLVLLIIRIIEKKLHSLKRFVRTTVAIRTLLKQQKNKS